MTVREWLQAGIDRYSALSRKERSLILLAAVLVVTVAWHHWLWTPQTRRLQRLDTERARLQQQATDLQDALQSLASSSSDNARQQLALQREELSRRLVTGTREMETRAAGFVAPAEVPVLLEALLAETPTLKVVRLSNLPVEPLIALDPDTVAGEGTLPNVYRHSFELEFEGGYDATLDYLLRGEKLAGKLFWDQLQYQVDRWPKGVTRLRVYTLSLSPAAVEL